MGLYRRLYEILASGREAAISTVVESGGGVEKTLHALPPGSEEAVLESLGAAKLPEGAIIAREGGSAVVIERLSPKPRLVIFGGGHIAQALAPMAARLDLDTVVYDDRPFFASPERFPQAAEVVCDGFDKISMPIRPADLVVIATRGHKHDEDCLSHVLSGPEPAYTGMIGSKRRVAIVRKLLAEDGTDPARLERLRSPIGLSIGAVTPAEIAVAILAEIIQLKRERQKSLGRGCLEDYADLSLLRFLAEREDKEGKDPAVLVTVVSTRGSTPRKAGAKMAAFLDGRSLGSIGGGCAEGAIIAEARRPGLETQIMRIDMTDQAEEDGMVCGGVMEVLVEPLP